MSWLPILLLLPLAGCASEAGPEEPSLVTDETGLIRGVVVDVAIVPVVGATVTILGAGNTTTDEGGAFLFSGLPAGTYQILVEKIGHFASRSTATVEAGVERPPIVKIVLEADPTGTPFVQDEVFEGFVQQGFTVATARAGSSDAPDQHFERLPEWFQIEMVWDSTQALGDGMDLTYISRAPNATVSQSFSTVRGTSPIHAGVDKNTLIANDIGGDTVISLAVFSAPSGPAPVALTLDQGFTLFMHRFYGFEPPEGWIFTRDGPVS